jgi:putative ABC transport system permease protein
MTFIGRKDLGFEKEHVVIVNETHVLRESIEPFRESLLALPGVLEAAPAEAVPGRALGESRYYMASDAAQTTETTLSRMYAGFGFVETLGIRIVEGRSISRDRSGDSTAVMLNVSAVRALGVADPIGKELVRSDGEVAYTVVGVVEDYHFESLKNRIGPLAVFGPDPFFANRPRQIVAVRIDDADVSRVVDRIAGKWADFVPEQPFRYGFLDEEFDALYRAERRAESLFSIFCGLAIVVACLGLFGLAAHTIEERSKEIAVRKILGATSYGVAGMLIRDLSRPVLIAFLVAAPPSYVAARAWLDTFAYRTDTTWQILVATGIVLAATTVFTVGMQAVRSASTPPAATLAAE